MRHVRDRCWILHPELKPKHLKENKGGHKSWNGSSHRANLATSSSEGMLDFTSNSSTLINEFTAFLTKKKHMHSGREEVCESGIGDHTALLGKFAGFLAEADNVPQEDASGILKSFSTALNVCSMNDYWIIDSGATDHMTNKIQNLHDFKNLSIPSKVSVANSKGVSVLEKGKIKILSDHTESIALYVPSFPF